MAATLAMLDAIRWLIAVEAIGWIALPVASRLFPGWADRGYAFSKVIGLVLVGWAAWLMSILGLVGFTGPTIVFLAVVLGVVGWGTWRTMAPDRAQMKLILFEEGLFALVFLLATAIRAQSPAIAGQEKQMDLTFLQALIRTDRLPAEDPWLAGFGLPYYYFGYLLYATLAKAAAIQPAVAYNLADITVVALAATGAAGLVANLLLSRGNGQRAATVGGPLAALALVGLGNLQPLVEILNGRGLGSRDFWTAFGVKNLGGVPPDGWLPADGSWWFRAARVIPNIQPDGITEFPFFSFLLGDLHPHYMALPLSVCILALSAHALFPKGETRSASEAEPGGRTHEAIQIGVPAVVLGAVIPTNTWDIPVLWGAFAAGSLGGAALQTRTWSGMRTAGARLAGTVVLAGLLYAPYFVGYVSQPLGLGLVTGRTPAGSLAVLFGVLLLLPVVAAPGAVASATAGRLRGPPGLVLGSGIVVAILLGLLREPTLGWLIGLLSVWGVVLWGRAQQGGGPSDIASAGLVMLGLMALLTPEIVFLRDLFGSRMNTVFKFYYDGWIFLALAVPLLASELWATAQGQLGELGRPWSRWFAVGGLGVSVAVGATGLLYPLAATPVRAQGFVAGSTLDGMVHLRVFRPDDAAAITYIQVALPSGTRVAEAVGDDYSDAARFSTFGGTVAPIGWVGHELQWRGPVPDLNARRDLVRKLYTDPTEADWKAALDELGVEYVAVGTLERELYGTQVDDRFAALEPAYQRGLTGATMLYRVNRMQLR
ncbi:MAG: hypothetical protein HY534_00730 [Chloroflexi bacterium]|nr:hypothetical protein [Chloroflexota bacterium]